MTTLSPFIKLALLQDGVSPKSAPGPVRPADQTNGIKPIVIPNHAAEDPNAVSPEQTKAEQGQVKAEQTAQQAQMKALEAGHQQKLQQQQILHTKAMSNAANNMGAGYFGKRFSTTMGNISKLTQQASMSRLNHGLYGLKTAADAPSAPTLTRSGKPWPTGRAAPTGVLKGPHIADLYRDNGINYKALQAGHYGDPAAPVPGVMDTLWNGIKEPSKALPIARAGISTVPGLNWFAGDKPVTPFGETPWQPFSNSAKPGTVGALMPTSLLNGVANATQWMGNKALNLPRVLGNAGLAVGATGLGAASHTGQAYAAAPDAYKELSAAHATPEGIWNTPTDKLTKTKAMLGQLGSGALDTANTAFTVTPWKGVGLAAKPIAKLLGLSFPLMEGPMANMGHDATVAQATAQQQALREAAAKAGQPLTTPSGSGEWLQGLLGQLGTYLKNRTGSMVAGGQPQTLPSTVGAQGLPVRSMTGFLREALGT
jgi:hypothetical protein